MLYRNTEDSKPYSTLIIGKKKLTYKNIEVGLFVNDHLVSIICTYCVSRFLRNFDNNIRLFESNGFFFNWILLAQ